MYKSEKPYLVYFASELEEPLNIVAYCYAEAVHKGIEFIRNNKLLTTIKKVEEIKFV